MRKATSLKHVNSMALFKFCQRVLNIQRNMRKVNDQEIGQILGFNPSDCSHWKRGKKAVKSVQSISKIADYLNVDNNLISDIANGALTLDEAVYEFTDYSNVNEISKHKPDKDGDLSRRESAINKVVSDLLTKANYVSPPLYMPEILSLFPYIVTQPMEMTDRFSRILKGKNNSYIIKYKKGDLRPQTRLSTAKNLGKIILDYRRSEYVELPEYSDQHIQSEINYFASSLLVPKGFLVKYLSEVDLKKNLVTELASLFWVPKSLMSRRIKEIMIR